MDLGVTAANALLLTSSEDWFSLGQDKGTTYTEDLAAMADGITSLLLVRMVALHRPTDYTDLSTTTIASVIVNTGQGEWPADLLPPGVVAELRHYVTFILKEYRTDVPFHNPTHAYHVVLSANKLLDQMLHITNTTAAASGAGDDKAATSSSAEVGPPPTYGLRSDPIALLALLWAALIHDVGHTGITNRQHVVEQDTLALRYNDESIHENHALAIAFEALLQPDSNTSSSSSSSSTKKEETKKADQYKALREVLFPADAHYRYFRRLVVDIVLSTDLASPLQHQMFMSKFTAAFPRPLLHHDHEEDGQILLWINDSDQAASGDGTAAADRRGSLLSTISKPRAGKNAALLLNNNGRRGSTQSVSSVISDISTDSFMLMRQQNTLRAQPGLLTRRLSNQSYQSYDSMMSDEYDSVYQNYTTGNHRQLHHANSSASPKSPQSARSGKFGSPSRQRRQSASGLQPPRSKSMDSNDSMIRYVEKAMNGEPIVRHVESATSLQANDLEAMRAAAVGLTSDHRHDSGLTSHGSGSNSSYGESLMAAESIDLAQKRRKGRGLSRFRRHSQNEASRNQLPGARYLNYDDDDDELSLTPPSSDDEMEMEGVIITGASGKEHFDPSAPTRKVSRRRSSVQSQHRRGSTASNVFNIQEEDPNDMNDSSPNLALEIEAKHNASTDVPGLGLRRTIDLSGESIDQYSCRDSVSVCSAGTELLQHAKNPEYDLDQPDELRSSVVLGILLRIADVSYWFQNEDIFIKYSRRFFDELVAAHEADRGMDPRPKWVQNQLNMADQYLSVLAWQLQRTGVYGRMLDFWFPLPDPGEGPEWRFPTHVLVKSLAK